MPTIVSNLMLRKLAEFPSQLEAVAYARQKLAEGMRGVNVVPAGSKFQVNMPIRLLF